MTTQGGEDRQPPPRREAEGVLGLRSRPAVADDCHSAAGDPALSPAPDPNAESAPPPAHWRHTVRDLGVLGLPIALSSLAQFSLTTVNLAFVGRLGVSQLSGAATAAMLVNATGFAVAHGLCGALDTILSQMCGSGIVDHRYGKEAQRAAGILLVVCVPILVLWWASPSIFLALGFRPRVVEHAAVYLNTMSVALPFIALFELLRRYLQAMRVTQPITVAVGVAAALNPIALETLISRMGFGFAGAPMAWAAAVVLTSTALLAYTKRVAGPTWGGLDLGVMFSAWGPLLQLGIPCAAATLAEWAAFEISGLAAGFASPKDLAAFSVVNQLATLLWTCSSGFCAALCVVVGNAVGAGHPLEARATAQIGTVVVACGSGLVGGMILAARDNIGGLFTADPAVQERVADLMPVLAVYQLVDAVVSAGTAVARGIGCQRFAAFCTSGSLLLVGVPVGLLLCFSANLGVGALLAGPAIGYVGCIALYGNFFRRLQWADIRFTDIADARR